MGVASNRPPQNGDLLRQRKNQTAYLRMVRTLEPVRPHLQILSGGSLKNKPKRNPQKKKGISALKLKSLIFVRGF